MKPTKWTAEGKKMRQEKRKKMGGEKAKSKSKDCYITFKPQNFKYILLSAHAWTLQANSLYVDQKAAECTTCKWLYGKF